MMWLRVLLLGTVAIAVDRSNFKNCQESGFCRRNRALKPGDSPFVVQPETIRITNNKLAAVLLNRRSDKEFKLSLSSFQNSTFQLRVEEDQPIRPRFRPTDNVLDDNLVPLDFEVQKKEGNILKMRTPEKNRFVLTFRPFRLDVFSGADIVMSLNSQGLMKFEHYRKKAEKKEVSSTALVLRIFVFHEERDEIERDLSAQLKHQKLKEPKPETDAEKHSDDGESAGEEKPEEKAEENEDGMWEENFKSHQDSKPYGPSSVGLDVSFIGFSHLYGIPEHAHSFKLQSTSGTEPYRLYNLDVAEYELNSHMALYGSIPYVVAHSAEKTIGFLWLNPTETWVDVKSNTADKGFLSSVVDKLRSAEETPQVDTHWFSESGLLEMYLFLGPKPQQLFAQYAAFTGVTPLPPVGSQFMFKTLWSLAYHQCRWNYNDQEDVRQVHENFDRHDIPMDVIWLDIEHTDGKRYFTWDSHKFPDPTAMISGLAAKGRKLVTIVDPHIKKDDNYKVYKDAKDLGYFTKTRDGAEFDGWCWPGSSAYLDFLNPTVQEYWANLFSYDNYKGSSKDQYIWNDMNEPSVFNGPEITMHKDARHFGDWEHREVHNVYGFYHHRSTFKGLAARSGGTLRPFLLTRAFFVGSQRYGAVWTGDNTAEWSHLRASIPMLLSLSVSGVPFVGADVGGFFKNPDEELLARWYQAGAYIPFFRAHAHLDTKRREPWLFSNDTLTTIRDAIRQRYKLLPYWYSKFHEHTKTGLPVMRPLWLEFPKDKYALDEEREFMVGDALLVRPVTEPGVKSVSLYLPGEGGVWYDFDTHRPQPSPGAVWVETPLSKTPVFIRGGTIFATKERVRRASTLTYHDPYTIYVALDYAGRSANGTIYADDYSSFEYEQGKYIYRRLSYSGDAYTGRVKSINLAPLEHQKQNYYSDAWIERIVVMGMRWYPEQVQILYGGGGMILKHKFEGKRMRLEVKKPNVKIGQDWELVITS